LIILLLEFVTALEVFTFQIYSEVSSGAVFKKNGYVLWNSWKQNRVQKEHARSLSYIAD
jgi:hypothetical protein